MVSSGQEPDDWSSMVNGCGSLGTDVGFALNRYIQETSILGSIAPSSPASDSQALSLPIEEDSDSDTELNEIRSELPKLYYSEIAG